MKEKMKNIFMIWIGFTGLCVIAKAMIIPEKIVIQHETKYNSFTVNHEANPYSYGMKISHSAAPYECYFNHKQS